MKGRDVSSDSFDPRSWGAGRPAAPVAEAAPGAGAGGTGSFDPSTWISDAPAPPADAAPPSEPTTVRPRQPLGRRTVAAASSGAILACGALAAYLSRDETVAAPASTVIAESRADAPQAPGSSRRTVTLAGPEMVLSSLTDFGLAPADAQIVAQRLLAALGSAPGEIRLDAQLAPGAAGGLSLVALEATRNDGSGAMLTASGAGEYQVEKLASRLETKILSARGEMDTTSFYSSAVAAGISDSVISDFAAAFSFDVDFQWEVKPGDIFEAAFEQAYNPAGAAVGPPRLLFASLRLENKSLRLYRFKAPGQNEYGWFDANGRSNVRSLMRTPVDGARVSSKFGYRTHPIQGFKKLHRGTDFAAPTGTPVFASGSATVISASPAGGAGNLVKLQHENGWMTKYMHLNSFAPGMGAGVRITQGQKIGEVGSTGASTGPHLHYEVWIKEEPVDPQTIDTGTGVTLDGGALDAFRQERDRIDLARAQRVE